MPLWGLSKLVSLGLTGLGSTGVGVYFSPLLSTTKDDRYGLIPDARGLQNDIYPFLEKESKLSKELKDLYINFKIVLKEAEKKKAEKSKEIEQNFEEVTKQETTLEQEYKTSGKLIQELEKISKSQFDANQRKLEFQAALNGFQNYNKLMSQASAAMQNWGNSLKQFICAIEKKGDMKDCVDKAKEWLQDYKENQVSTSVLEPNKDSDLGGALKHQKMY